MANKLDNKFVLIRKDKRDDVPPSRQKNKSLDLPFAEMIYIPGGTFEMGDTRNETSCYNGHDAVVNYQKPEHIVKVNSFLMGKYEVAQRQWENVMGSNPSSLLFPKLSKADFN